MIIHIYSIAATFPPGQLPVQLPDPLEESSLLEPSIGEVEVGPSCVEEGMQNTINPFLTDTFYPPLKHFLLVLEARTRTEKRKITKMRMKLENSHKRNCTQNLLNRFNERWAAVYSLFIGSTYINCAFSFIFICFYLFQVQDLGLAAAYSRDDGTYRYIKKLMALPFLPAPEIDPAFQRLRLKATTDALEELVEYISETWISSTVFPPKDTFSSYLRQEL